MGFREVCNMGRSDPMVLENGQCSRAEMADSLLKGYRTGSFLLPQSLRRSRVPRHFIRHSQLPLDGIGVSKRA